MFSGAVEREPNGDPGLTTIGTIQLPTEQRASLLATRTLLVAPGLTTRNKKLRTGLLASLRTERSDATNGAPGLTTSNNVRYERNKPG